MPVRLISRLSASRQKARPRHLGTRLSLNASTCRLEQDKRRERLDSGSRADLKASVTFIMTCESCISSVDADFLHFARCEHKYLPYMLPDIARTREDVRPGRRVHRDRREGLPNQRCPCATTLVALAQGIVVRARKKGVADAFLKFGSSIKSAINSFTAFVLC